MSIRRLVGRGFGFNDGTAFIPTLGLGAGPAPAGGTGDDWGPSHHGDRTKRHDPAKDPSLSHVFDPRQLVAVLAALGEI